MGILDLDQVSKTFIVEDGRPLNVLKEITLEVKPSEFLVLLGPSGSGKSTILRIMSGLEKDFQGNLKLANDLKPTDFSFIFQQYALLPWLTVFQNVQIGLLSRHLSAEKRLSQVENILTDLGLVKFSQNFPRQLSGGMKQRVGIARALVTNPKIIFMDEPFSSLDSFTAKELRKEVLDLWQKTKTTIVMVTHLISEALELANRIAVLTPSPGQIAKIIEINLPRSRQIRSPAFFDLEDRIYRLITAAKY